MYQFPRCLVSGWAEVWLAVSSRALIVGRRFHFCELISCLPQCTYNFYVSFRPSQTANRQCQWPLVFILKSSAVVRKVNETQMRSACCARKHYESENSSEDSTVSRAAGSDCRCVGFGLGTLEPAGFAEPCCESAVTVSVVH